MRIIHFRGRYAYEEIIVKYYKNLNIKGPH